MQTIRSFIAIELSLPIQQQLSKLLSELQRKPLKAINWVSAKNIHLTLQFLGEVNLQKIDSIKKALEIEAQHHVEFQFSVGGMGCFPNLRRPRVVWVGIKAPPNLQLLQKGIEAALIPLGFQPEERPFSPHLTLGRVSQNANPNEVDQVSRTLTDFHVGELGESKVNGIRLFRSELTSTGAVYSSLFLAPLKSSMNE